MAAGLSTGSNFNRYKYAANNPFRYYDPDGRAEAGFFNNKDGLFYNTNEAFHREGYFSFGGHGNENFVQDQTGQPENLDAYQLHSVLSSQFGLAKGMPAFSISCRFGMAGPNGTQAQTFANLNEANVYGADGWVNYDKRGSTVTLTVWEGRNKTGEKGAFQLFTPGGNGPVRGSEITRITVDLNTGAATATVRHAQPRTGTRIKTESVRIKKDPP